MLPQPGEKVGRYTILERLGQGGMGVVFSAYDERLDRKIAIKLLHGTGEALLSEARALAKVAHPNVVAVHDAQELFGQIAIAMEYVPGSDLRAWLRQQPRSEAEVLQVMLEAGRGLAAAHEAGVVHRDFKPENVLVGADGRARVTDFGLAHVGDASDGRAGIGTPGYVAPEQAAGLPADARADQYAFCVTLAEALTGKNPFKVMATPNVPLVLASEAAATLPGGRIRAVVERGLARDPSNRFPSMPALLAALTPKRKAQWPLIAGLSAVGLLVLGAGWGYGAWRDAEARECSGAEERLAGIWDAPTRAALKTHFEGTKASFGPSAWAATERGLDAWAKAWATARREACEATRKQHQQPEDVLDLRVSCFERLRTEAGALVQVLKAGDDAVVAKAPRAVAELKDVAICADVAELKTTVPIAPALQAQKVALQATLAELTARRTSGNFKGLVDETAKLVADAKALGWQPLIAEALVERSIALEDAGKAADEWKVLEEAVVAAEAGRSYNTVARAYAYLLLATMDLDKMAEADLLYRHCRAVLAQAPNVEREAQVEAYFGNVLRKRGAFAEAMEHGKKGLALAESLKPPKPLTTAVAANMLALTHSALNRDDEAARLTQVALDAYAGVLGPEHPDVGLMRLNSALPRYSRGDFKGAITEAEAGTAILVKAYGGDNLRIAIAQGATGKILVELGRVDEAIALETKALEMRQRLLGDKSIDAARMHSYRGEAELVAKRYEDARADYQAAVDVFETGLGKKHPYRVEALTGLASALVHLGRAKEAQVAAQAARENIVAEDMDTAALAVLELAEAQIDFALGLPKAAAIAKAEKAWAEMSKDPTYGSARPEVEAWLAKARGK